MSSTPVTNHYPHPPSAPTRRNINMRNIPEQIQREVTEPAMPRVMSTSALRIPKQRNSFWQRYCMWWELYFCLFIFMQAFNFQHMLSIKIPPTPRNQPLQMKYVLGICIFFWIYQVFTNRVLASLFNRAVTKYIYLLLYFSLQQLQTYLPKC